MKSICLESESESESATATLVGNAFEFAVEPEDTKTKIFSHACQSKWHGTPTAHVLQQPANSLS